MPLYTYRCEHCHEEMHLEMSFAEHDALPRDSMAHTPCLEQGYMAYFKQVLSFAFHRGTPEHYNHSLDAYVSNDAQIRSELSRQSDEMSARMGFDHQYELVDPSDPASYGVTDEGMEATERVARNSGEIEPQRKVFT